MFPRAKRWATWGLGGVAVIATLFLLDRFMPAVGPFWSQKNVVAAYYRTRRSPDERLVAYQMYWRGETFYTENEIYEGPPADRTVFDQDGADDRLKDYLGHHRGRRNLLPDGERPEIARSGAVAFGGPRIFSNRRRGQQQVHIGPGGYLTWDP